MVTCELDKDVSGEILGWKLPAWKALLLHRVLPSCGGLLVYLTLICFDLALVYEHYRNGDEGLVAFCLILMTLPSILSLIFTLASPPPGLQTELSTFTVTAEKKEVKWILQQIANALFFPIAAIGRYCFQIFWWIEAVCAARVQDQKRADEAIQQARTPSPVELYLFLQAFIHCAPHAILNILDLMARLSHSTFDKVSVQSVSIVASSLRMASTATLYRRFEREKICGKSYPWSENTKEDTEILITDRVISNSARASKKNEEENIYEPVLNRDSYLSDTSYGKRMNSDLIQLSPRTTADSSSFHNQYDKYSDIISDTSSEYLPPISPQKEVLSRLDSDSEYVRPLSIIDRVAPRRREPEYTIEKVDITPPPIIPAPRPGSLAVWAEKLVENAENFPTWLSAPPRYKYHEVVQDEPDLPQRVPRTYMRGLEPQDATAALVHFLGWHMFFIARLLSIACFISFFPFLAIVILFCHYQVMLLFLIVPQASTHKRAFYIFLAFIYLFCLMEFKIRFRHVRVWHVFWIIVCTAETILFTGFWASTDNNADDWWKWYVVKVIYGGLLLSYTCFIIYFILLKPRETIVYRINKNNATN